MEDTTLECLPSAIPALRADCLTNWWQQSHGGRIARRCLMAWQAKAFRSDAAYAAFTPRLLAEVQRIAGCPLGRAEFGWRFPPQAVALAWNRAAQRLGYERRGGSFVRTS